MLSLRHAAVPIYVKKQSGWGSGRGSDGWMGRAGVGRASDAGGMWVGLGRIGVWWRWGWGGGQLEGNLDGVGFEVRWDVHNYALVKSQSVS